MSDYVNVSVETEVEVQVECYCQECGAGVLDRVEETGGNGIDVYASVCEACLDEAVERQIKEREDTLRREIVREIIEQLAVKYGV